MTNWQLLIAAGFPTATGLVSIALALIMNGRMEAKIDRVEASLEAKIDRVEASLNARIDKIEAVLNGRIDRIADDLKEFYMILGKHDKSIDLLEKKQGN